jgi:hypothetical protein
VGAERVAPFARKRAQGAAALPEGIRVGDRSDLDTVDPAALRTARTQMHQGVGALELVGLPSAARLLRASEAAVQRMVNKPALVDEAAVHTIERASFALLDYLARLLAGKPVSPVACSRSTARCRPWPAPTVCTRPTCGKPTSPGTTCPTNRVWCRAPPTMLRAAPWKPSCCA